MAFEHKDNTGSLFKNTKKSAATHSDYNGTLIVNGVTYWINAWLKDGKTGKFMSLSVKPKDAAAAKPAPKQEPRKSARDDFQDEVPF